MPQSLTKLYVHIIFSTKNRSPLLEDENIRNQMYAYLASILREFNCPALVIGGTVDHIHILCTLSKTTTLTDVIREIKRNSSKWIKTKGTQYNDFYWQSGYGAFSVSYSNIPHARDYIINQQEHHKQTTFQDELRSFLKKHGIEFDERYIWD
jgi:putative transposase